MRLRNGALAIIKMAQNCVRAANKSPVSSGFNQFRTQQNVVGDGKLLSAPTTFRPNHLESETVTNAGDRIRRSALRPATVALWCADCEATVPT